MIKNKKWLGVSMLMFAVMTLTGCKDSDITPVPPVPEPDPDPVVEPVKTASELLSEMPGVTIIKDTVDVDKLPVTYFYYEQPIDHTDATAGTFKQYCALHYKGPDHVTVLHTQGYSTQEPKFYKQLDIAKNLDANYIEVEHRYYMHSLINFEPQKTDCYGDYWKVNTAAQSTADLHAIVTALKGTNCFKNKWVSTGVSKNGILTSLYAYYYPNEVDVYVPFCAPFCTGLESSGIGQWLSQQSGLDNGNDTQLRKDVWAAFQRIASDLELQKEMVALFNLERNKNYSHYVTVRFLLYMYMADMFYKFCYKPTNEWDDVIPKPGHSAEIYYRFTMLGKDKYEKNLKLLREELQVEDEVLDSLYDDSDYLIDDEDEIEIEAASRRVAPTYLKLDELLKDIYHVHAAMELGYFLYDFASLLPEDHLLRNEDLEWFPNYQSFKQFNNTYGVTYDGGKLMNAFLDFVKNNRNKDKCKMVFIYGGNDPWTGAAIPDPDTDDPYVKKHIVPNGVHSGWINYESQYPAADKEWIMNTVNEMLKK